jgi:hypothetical protein
MPRSFFKNVNAVFSKNIQLEVFLRISIESSVNKNNFLYFIINLPKFACNPNKTKIKNNGFNVDLQVTKSILCVDLNI